MSYYDTIEEDLARAKTILEKGKMRVDEIERHVPVPPGLAREIIERGGTIYGADIYAAYKLLESFVAFIESGKIEKLENAATALGQEWKRVAAEWNAMKERETRLHEEVRRLRALATTDEQTIAHNLATIARLRTDTERERAARRIVDEALRQAVEDRDVLRAEIETRGRIIELYERQLRLLEGDH